MDIIMTHEQTDFDGFASTLGAYLLEDRSYPLLPNNLPQALPKQNINSITLVDTQSMITLKGITNQTQVCVFDHHKKREDFNPEWDFIDIPTGACTTYFVEHLIEHNGSLTMIQATLLLLGIYEDTGSLTYTGSSKVA